MFSWSEKKNDINTRAAEQQKNEELLRSNLRSMGLKREEISFLRLHQINYEWMLRRNPNVGFTLYENEWSEWYEKRMKEEPMELDRKLRAEFRRPISEMSKNEVKHWLDELYLMRTDATLKIEVEEELGKRSRELHRDELELIWAAERGEEMKPTIFADKVRKALEDIKKQDEEAARQKEEKEIKEIEGYTIEQVEERLEKIRQSYVIPAIGLVYQDPIQQALDKRQAELTKPDLTVTKVEVEQHKQEQEKKKKGEKKNGD